MRLGQRCKIGVGVVDVELGRIREEEMEAENLSTPQSSKPFTSSTVGTNHSKSLKQSYLLSQQSIFTSGNLLAAQQVNH